MAYDLARNTFSVGSIDGYVMDFNGLSITRTTVLIVNGPDHFDLATQTDMNGYYFFDFLTKGTYVLKTIAENYNLQIQKCFVSPPKNTILNFFLSKKDF